MSSRELDDRREHEFVTWVAGQLGLSVDELEQLEWSHDEDTLADGTATGLVINFDESVDPAILAKVRNISGHQAHLPLPPENPTEPERDDRRHEEEQIIDPALIQRWFAIGPAEAIDIELPRASLDMLYIAIERSYFALAQAVEMVTAQHRGDAVARDSALDQIKADVVQGLNSLRRFQTIVMASATKSRLDDNGKVQDTEGLEDGR